MVHETLDVAENNSALAETAGIIISVTSVTSAGGKAKLVVGRPGLPNVVSDLAVGGAVLFETPDGLFEIRLLSVAFAQVRVLLSQISPRPGIAGGFVDQDSDNARFTTDELARIAASVEQIMRVISERSDVSREQLDFISRKLDYMQQASERMGRKDWMNLAFGTLTSIIVTASLTPNIAKALLQAADIALSWLFGGGIKLLL